MSCTAISAAAKCTKRDYERWSFPHGLVCLYMLEILFEGIYELAESRVNIFIKQTIFLQKKGNIMQNIPLALRKIHYFSCFHYQIL